MRNTNWFNLNRIRLSTFLIAGILYGSYALGQENISIIPEPQQMKVMPGCFTINSNTRIYVNNENQELKRLAITLSSILQESTGDIIYVENPRKRMPNNSIILSIDNALDTLGEEGYLLDINAKKIILRAFNTNGIFYGIQTLYQLLPVEPSEEGPVSLPQLNIADKPRFGWRGLMLDVGRYFYPVSFIKKYINYMSMNKLNVFHWHLTEDAGWRIEIKKYPELTQIGAWREKTQLTHTPATFDNIPHGGYYTQDEIRDVVSYARERYVTIIPEIEMPGHTMSSLAAYPELSCTGGPFKVPEEWGVIRKDIYCAGNEQTFRFLEDVLSEVIGLFPGQYIHIGGDEAPKDRWKTCPKCQKRIHDEKLKDENELQSYFIRRIGKFLESKNKRMIGWDEILEGGLAPNATVMSWRGTKGGIAAANQNHDVIMSPNSHLYFDYYQGEDKELEPFAIGGNTPLAKVYTYEPLPRELAADKAKYIKGVEAAIWTQYVHSGEAVEYMTWPRATALAELAWTNPENKNWESFKQRMGTEYKRYEQHDINYAKTAFNVQQSIKIDSINNVASVKLWNSAYDTKIYYTLDGTEPTISSIAYNKKFWVNKSAIVKAASFLNGRRTGKVTTREVRLKNR